MDEEILKTENQDIQEELDQKEEFTLEEATESSEQQPQKKSLKEKIKETDQRNSSVWQAVKFIIFSVSAGVIQFVTFTLLKLIFDKTGITESWGTMWFFQEMPKSTFTATTIALALSVIWNFTLNRKITFKASSNVPLSMALAFLFYVPFYPFQTWYVGAVENALIAKEVDATLAGIIGEFTVMGINFGLEFLWQKFVVFRKPKKKDETEEDTTETAQEVQEEEAESETIEQ